MLQTIIHEIQCKVGQNAKENWELIDKSKPEYFFFHLSSFPSCYVVLECENIPYIETIIACAKLCKSRTKYKNVPNLYVDYCTCGNLRKFWKVGEVEFRSNKKTLKIMV